MRGPFPAVVAVALLASCTTGPTGAPGLATSGPTVGVGAGTTPGSSGASSTLPEPTEQPSARASPTPVEVVQAFYDWYLEGRQIEEVLARPELSPALVDFLGSFDEPHDPFVCSEELPESVRAVASSLSGKTAIVSTIVSPDGTSEEPGPPIDMVVSNTGEWQLAFVGCWV